LSIKLDELDLKIVDCLNKDGRISVTELSNMVGASRPTVTSRLRHLLERRALKVRGGLDARSLGFKVATVGLDVKSEGERGRVLETLRNCPRVLSIYRGLEMASLALFLWGEDEETLKSTIESYQRLTDGGLTYTHYLGTPLHGDTLIGPCMEKGDEASCGSSCPSCSSYQNEWCSGCPSTKFHKSTFSTG
jgi:Lrp/AsnC family leucine-responsive transcriptional regulator